MRYPVIGIVSIALVVILAPLFVLGKGRPSSGGSGSLSEPGKHVQLQSFLPNSKSKAALERGQPLFKKGYAAERRGDLQEAATLYAEASRVSTPFMDPYINERLAIVLERLGRREEALEAYREAVRDDSRQGRRLAPYRKPSTAPVRISSSFLTDATVLARYGDLALRLGEQDEARAAFEQAVSSERASIGPSYPVATTPQGTDGLRAMAWMVAGHRYRGHGDKPQSLKAYAKALKLQPDWEAARFYYALGLRGVGRLQESQDALKKLVNSPDKIVAREAKRLTGTR